MALSLSPEPSNGPHDTDTSLRVPMAETVNPEAMVSQLPPVVLCVPEVGGTKESIKPSRKQTIEPKVQLEESDTPSEKSLFDARSRVTQLVEAWQSIDWAEVSCWATRPVVTYSAAGMIAVIIIVAVVGRSRTPEKPAAQKPPIVADDESGSQPPTHHLSKDSTQPKAPIEKQTPPPVAPPSPTRPRERDEVVKLPPVTGPNESILPWRRDSSGTSAPQQDIAENTPPSTAGARDATVPFPPAESTSERPNVARFEGRIHTPKLPR